MFTLLITFSSSLPFIISLSLHFLPSPFLSHFLLLLSSRFSIPIFIFIFTPLISLFLSSHLSLFSLLSRSLASCPPPFSFSLPLLHHFLLSFFTLSSHSPPLPSLSPFLFFPFLALPKRFLLFLPSSLLLFFPSEQKHNRNSHKNLEKNYCCST